MGLFFSKMPVIATNKNALFNSQVLEKFEAGLVLSGPEVKAVKSGRINLKGSYLTFDPHNEIYLANCHIGKYAPATSIQQNYNPTRPRKLLLHKKEILSLMGKSKIKGLTLLPLKVYTKGGLIKVEIGLVRGKKEYDKREIIKKREMERKIRRALKGRN